jgi:catechol 2,3-dioxygenase-like lactoylglutathione lyase family enzyme
MRLGGVNHVSFPVGDLERSLRFYRDTLGLVPIPRPDFGALAGAWLSAGDVQVHLIVTPEGADVGRTPAATNPLAAHTAFAIDDYDATKAALEAAGIAVAGLGAAAGQMWVQDPDGHVIELIVPGARA